MEFCGRCLDRHINWQSFNLNQYAKGVYVYLGAKMTDEADYYREHIFFGVNDYEVFLLSVFTVIQPETDKPGYEKPSIVRVIDLNQENEFSPKEIKFAIVTLTGVIAG